MEGSVVVSKNEQFCFRILEDFRAGKLKRREAAELLGVSERTVQRKASRLRQNGIKGLKHGNHQRRPKNLSDGELKQKILSLVAERYFDFNMVHCLEMLEKHHELKVSYSTFRRWCLKLGTIKRKRRRPSKARTYRDRLASQGLLLQMDGSHHKWNQRDEWVLISMIDDATSDMPYAEFFRSEDTWNCLTVLRRVIEIRGIPEAIYVDKAGWFGGLKRQQFSQFVRTCDELGIRVIYANSPEAKGRIERAWQTFQDRLIPELRLHEIIAMEAANKYLLERFLPDYWAVKNTVIPKSRESRYRPIPQELNLDAVFCMKYIRTVRNDNTVSFDGECYQLKGGIFGNLRGKEIEMRQTQQGELSAYYGHQKLDLKKTLKPQRAWQYLRATKPA